MKPIVFEETVGWLHPGSGERGLVIAGAHGFEDLCSRRFLTLLARNIATAGMPVLQFDYPGCGDAVGDHNDPGRVAAWIASIGQAIDCLKSKTGVADVLVVGFRLGALLAPSGIAGRNDVAGVALLAPPSSGAAYVREMIGLSRMIDATIPCAPDAAGEAFEGIEAAGFRMTSETISDIRGLEWQDQLIALNNVETLLVPPQPTALHQELAQRIGAHGGTVRIEPFNGFSRLMSNPTANDIPLDMLRMIAQWSAGLARPGRTFDAPADPIPAGLGGDGYCESPVVLELAPQICGVLCLPIAKPAASMAVLILNAGAIPHVGWARGAVDMARALARQGIASFRADLPGLGQSDAPTEKRLFLYDERGRDDVNRMLDVLTAQGFAQICVVGICAGAYQAFHAARHEPRITSLAMVNPLCFAWNSSYALDMGLSKIRDNASGPLSEDTGELLEAAVHEPPAKRGTLGASISKLGKGSLRRLLEMFKSGFARSHIRSVRSVEHWVQQLTERGTKILIVSCDDDLSLREIERHFGPDGERLKCIKGVTTARIQASDHTLTPPHARIQLHNHLANLLGATSSAQTEPPPRTAPCNLNLEK